jgi:hypothetical protein
MSTYSRQTAQYIKYSQFSVTRKAMIYIYIYIYMHFPSIHIESVYISKWLTPDMLEMPIISKE